MTTMKSATHKPHKQHESAELGSHLSHLPRTADAPRVQLTTARDGDLTPEAGRSESCMVLPRAKSFCALASILFVVTGCPARTSSGRIPNTPAEESYVISKAEPPSSCRVVGGFFGYETPCGSSFGAVPDDVQFSCIRREISKAGGNYGVIDAVVGAGWYKGRAFACPPGPLPRTTQCTPGITQACVGPGGCQGGQACSDDGLRYSTCDCGQVKSP